MSDPNAGLPPRYLRTPEAARFLSLSGRTLEKHRTYGTGPAYRKLGGRVVYALEDLKAWADRRRQDVYLRSRRRDRVARQAPCCGSASLCRPTASLIARGRKVADAAQTHLRARAARSVSCASRRSRRRAMRRT